MTTQFVFILGVCMLGLCGHMTSAIALPQEDMQSSESTSTDEKSADIRASLDRLENYLYDLKERLDRIRQLYNADEVIGEESDNAGVAVKRKPHSSGFIIVKGRRAVEETQDWAEQPRQRGDLMSLLEYYRALHNNKRGMFGVQSPGQKRHPPPTGFHAVRGRRSLHRTDISE